MFCIALFLLVSIYVLSHDFTCMVLFLWNSRKGHSEVDSLTSKSVVSSFFTRHQKSLILDVQW